LTTGSVLLLFRPPEQCRSSWSSIYLHPITASFKVGVRYLSQETIATIPV